MLSRSSGPTRPTAADSYWFDCNDSEQALATDAELVLADDISSALDARTEVELWEALRSRGTTVLGSTSKQAALRQADRVVVLDVGLVVAIGPWSELAADWGHLAADRPRS